MLVQSITLWNLYTFDTGHGSINPLQDNEDFLGYIFENYKTCSFNQLFVCWINIPR